MSPFAMSPSGHESRESSGANEVRLPANRSTTLKKKKDCAMRAHALTRHSRYEAACLDVAHRFGCRVLAANGYILR
jgi:hypothetical protein